jgi:hypothetical protein
MLKAPKMSSNVKQQETPQAPTIDQAAMQAEQNDAMRRRRLKGRQRYMQRQPANDAPGNVGVKTLTGQ